MDLWFRKVFKTENTLKTIRKNLQFQNISSYRNYLIKIYYINMYYILLLINIFLDKNIVIIFTL